MNRKTNRERKRFLKKIISVEKEVDRIAEEIDDLLDELDKMIDLLTFKKKKRR